LEQRGLIGLPPRRQVPTNRMRCVGQEAGEPEWDQGRIDCDLAQLDGQLKQTINMPLHSV